MKKRLQKTYLSIYNLLIAQGLWLAHYQILLIILLRKIIKLNVNMDIIMKNVKLIEFNTKIASAALNTQKLNMI